MTAGTIVFYLFALFGSIYLSRCDDFYTDNISDKGCRMELLTKENKENIQQWACLTGLTNLSCQSTVHTHTESNITLMCLWFCVFLSVSPLCDTGERILYDCDSSTANVTQSYFSVELLGAWGVPWGLTADTHTMSCRWCLTSLIARNHRAKFRITCTEQFPQLHVCTSISHRCKIRQMHEYTSFLMPRQCEL